MPASPSTARAINDRLALRLLQHEGPLTAGQLKQLTGLSRPSVADLVERLQGSGLITVVGETGERRRGPNARLYGIVADRAHLAALDVRTESVSVVVADLLGAQLAEATVPIGGGTGTGDAVERAVALVERTARAGGAGRLHTVGVGAPGLIDPATGDLRDSAGLPTWHRRLVAALTERLPARVLVENETNLAARAEQRDGAAHDRDTFVLLWLGAGTGAAVVLDGTLRRGASGGTGEIGFLPVPGTAGLPSATACDGGFHSLAGSAAVEELAADHGLKATPEPSELPAAALVRHAVESCHTPFLDALADRVAIGAASVTAVLDPGCVVLGGELGRAGGEVLAGRVGERVAAMSPLRTEVRASVLGGAAVLRGALLTARDAAQEELFAPGG
ncbi:ROK family transcriptional regulator [Streptomyces flavofungini]|uniref:ROK family transcriptional regulator n=1 Tax=Streptomyces flavofungini TaxID=68200 RepID=A0ABS0XF37_9ACTN|nr:ROK family transcriptional regulator [Streptomyces flavofungini]MBJ3811519.1 ROK family transcriptional regulator [Streptomyces flavofungini]MBJ3811843.1 ROK family transcriptional regulator [Streptomyces flavofungini]GHC85639.1 transcriptional regulator [Streptomyces flavofungini]